MSLLKNYTTKIEADKSIGEIIGMLRDCNASGVSQEFIDRKCVAINFIMLHGDHSIAYKLTPKIDSAFEILMSKRKQNNSEVQKRVFDQANKTAWRIIRDWVDVQCAMIKLDQATPLQLFLSYAVRGNGKTHYEMINNDIKLLK